MNRDVIIRWLDKIALSGPGESIYLAVENRSHAKDLLKEFKKELRVLAEVDPIKANRIQLVITAKDQRFWLELQRTFGSPLIGFRKRPDGSLERIELMDPDRIRRLQLMKEDGYTLDEAIQIEGELSEEERSIFS